jgi:hypothetical protein
MGFRTVISSVVLVAAGFVAVSGSPATAAPAAEEGTNHCVVIVPNIDTMQCFPTYAQAKQFVIDLGALPPSGGNLRAACRPANVYTLLSVEFSGWFYGGDSIWFLGVGAWGNDCSSSKTDIDWELSSMPAGWNNRISSFTGGGCEVRHYDVANFGAPYVGYSPGEAAIGNGLNNDTTSIRWS